MSLWTSLSNPLCVSFRAVKIHPLRSYNGFCFRKEIRGAFSYVGRVTVTVTDVLARIPNASIVEVLLHLGIDVEQRCCQQRLQITQVLYSCVIT